MGEKLTVGQKLWKVSRFAEKWVEVTKVGRSWVSLSDGSRIHVATLVGEGNFDGRCYTTKEEHDEAVRLNRAWAFLRTKVNSFGSRPATTSDKIGQAIALLGYDVDEFRAALAREEGR